MTTRRVHRITGRRLAVLAAATAMAGVGGHSAVESAAAAERPPPATTTAAAAAGGMTQAEYDAAMADLRTRYPHIDDRAVAPAAIAWGGMASWLGQTVIGWGVGAGLDMGMGQLFGATDSTGHALGQIQQSLIALQDDVREVKAAIGQLQETADRAKFLDAEEENEQYATDIRWQSRLIAEWDAGAGDVHPDDVHTVVQLTARAVEQIRTGTVSGTTATLPLLQTLVGYQEPHVRWDQLDTYRDGYRTTLAVGLLNLKWAADRDSRYAAHLAVAEETVQSTVDALYRQGGVAHPQPWRFGSGAPEPAATLHPLGADWLMASAERPLLDGEERLATLTTRASIDPVIHALHADYAKGGHKSSTFAEYLLSQGIGPSIDDGAAGQAQFPHVDTFRIQSGNRMYRIMWDMTRVKDDVVEVRTRVSANEYTLAEAQARIHEYRQRAIDQAPYTLAVATNAAGWAVTDDQQAIRWATTGVRADYTAPPQGQQLVAPMTLYNGGADGMVGVDSVSGRIQGSGDLTGNPDEGHFVFAWPASGHLTFVVGDQVPGRPITGRQGPESRVEAYIVPKGTVTIATPKPDIGPVQLVPFDATGTMG